MTKLIYLIIYLISVSTVWGSEINVQFIERLNHNLEEIKSSNHYLEGPKANCQITNIDRRIYLSTIIDDNGKKQPIAVVSEEYAQELFQEMAKRKDIPFKYPEDGCYARAHKMSILLDKKGVIVAKVFVEGDLKVITSNSPKGFVEWWYHVAPIIKVKKDNKEKIYVIDPSLFDHAVPLEQWVKIQTSEDGTRKDDLYFTSRYRYSPSPYQSMYPAKKFSEDSKHDMEITLEQYTAVLRARELNK